MCEQKNCSLESKWIPQGMKFWNKPYTDFNFLNFLSGFFYALKSCFIHLLKLNEILSFCSGECFVTGQAHFKSFDNKYFTFSGICHYLLAKDTTDNTFSVAIETVQVRQFVFCDKSSVNQAQGQINFNKIEWVLFLKWATTHFKMVTTRREGPDIVV